MLLVSVLTLVLTFRSSTALAFAFGMAVTVTITTTLFYVARHRWRTPLPLVLGGAAVLLTVDAFFLAANLTKIAHGAWLPLLIGVSLFLDFTTWQRGRAIVAAKREREEGSLRGFLEALHDREVEVRRTPGTAVFLDRGARTVPLAMRATVDHLHALSEHVVILSIETAPVPHVPLEERPVVDDLRHRDDGVMHVTARFGYRDKVDVPAVVRRLDGSELECPIDEDLTYVLSTVRLTRGDTPCMRRSRRALFLATSRIAVDGAIYFHLPAERTLIVGSRIEV